MNQFQVLTTSIFVFINMDQFRLSQYTFQIQFQIQETNISVCTFEHWNSYNLQNNHLYNFYFNKKHGFFNQII